MNQQIYSFIYIKERFYPVQLYGYSSRSLPGLEINAPSIFSRTVKNKIIYFCRKQNIKIAPMRFVICYEEFFMGEKILQGQNKFLELPSLILFLQLAGVLNISSLNNCFSLGSFTIDGRIVPYNQLTSEVLSYVKEKQLTYLGDEDFKNDSGLKKVLILNGLLGSQMVKNKGITI